MAPGKRLFTPEQEAFIRENIRGKYIGELTAMVNERFGLNLTEKQMKAYKNNHKLNTGLTGHFPKGHVPFNKGRKGVNQGGVQTQFKKGHKPWNYMPVGSERINTDGYVDVKIADPNKWKAKHVLLWEAANGPVPKGHALVFGDGNPLNVSIDNLVLVTRRQLAVMNKRGLIQGSAELTKTGALIAELIMKTRSRSK